MKLTPKQKNFLAYIYRYMEAWGRAPSFDEICSEFGFRSYNTVTTYLKLLERKGYIRLPRQKNRKRAIEVISPVETRRFEFPLLGRVAAGRPIEAIEDRRVVEIPPSMAGDAECFVLQVTGTSMEEDGILDGDLVVVRRQAVAQNGDIVVALINNEEATVKRFFLRKEYIELRTENTDFTPMRYGFDEILVQGKVIGIQRGPEGVK